MHRQQRSGRGRAHELAIMEQAGKIHRRVLEDCVPAMLAGKDLSEAELGGEVYLAPDREGHHGIARFGMFGTEMVLAFRLLGRTRSIRPVSRWAGGFPRDGPGAPVLGSRERTQARRSGSSSTARAGVRGYHTDKTMIVRSRIAASRGTRGASPMRGDPERGGGDASARDYSRKRIYDTIIGSLEPAFLENLHGPWEAAGCSSWATASVSSWRDAGHRPWLSRAARRGDGKSPSNQERN